MPDQVTRATLPLPPNLVPFPRVKQTTGYSCGAAATLALLRYWRGPAVDALQERDLYGPLDTTPGNGTEPEPIAAHLARAGGLEVDYRHGDVTLARLERAVDAAQPPLVDLQAWRDTETPWREVWDAGHYVVLVGYDAEHLFFMDPSILTAADYAYLPRAELDERWHDLAGPGNLRLERMAVFVRGGRAAWTERGEAPTVATRLG